jgi:diguanylate cyclase (GGDEF)-like protein
MDGPRTTRRAGFLSTRFGRRIFAVFVACALVPIAALAAISWTRVAGELRSQSERRLHAASRSAGMRIVENLLEIDGALATLDPRTGVPAVPVPGGADLLAGIATRNEDGTWRDRFGEGVPVPALSAGDLGALALGRPVLRVVPEGGGRAIVLLNGRPGRPLSAARVREHVLFDLSAENVLPPDGEFCVFDTDGAALHCSTGASATLPEASAFRGGPEAISWTVRGTEYLAVPWPLFLKANFNHPGWNVLVAEPTAEVYAPIAAFRTNLVLVTALSLFLVSLLSVGQIRSRLAPLERLRAGTRRIAESEFATTVDVESDDEFGELAASFNAMARRLDAQFRSLEKVIEIDRAILAASDEEALAAAFLEPLRRVYPCIFSLLLVADTEGGGASRVYLRDADGRILGGDAPLLSENERDALLRLPSQRLLAASEMPEAWRARLPARAEAFLLTPLAIGPELVGLFLAGHESEADTSRDGALYVRQLCDQLAAALAGARLRRQNERLLRFDPLTGLPNRRSLEERLAARLTAPGPGRLIGVARLAVEGLDRVRTTFGPEEVDRILRRVGERLREESPSGAARLEGGEFGLLAEADSAEGLARGLRQLLAAAGDAVASDERAHILRVRAGAAVSPLDGHEADGLLRRADTALRHSREQSAAGIVFYAARMNEAVESRVRMESDLARAVERGELRLYYQPIVDAATRELVGAEALVRWQHPVLGVLAPGEFVALAEETGLISSIGRWVLRTACVHTRGWLDQGLEAVRVSVNVSPQQLQGHDLLSEVLGALASAGLPAALLGIELTESSLMGEDLAVVETLRAIHRTGVTLSIDDFGTGYSSLRYLLKFPLDALKLDRAFVQGVAEEADKRAITEAVLAMARGLGLRVVAEGVETEEQLRFLRERGCPLAQGYLFAEPLPEDAFRKLLSEGMEA